MGDGTPWNEEDPSEFDDELEEEWLQELEEADANFVAELQKALLDWRGTPPPPALCAAADGARAGLDRGGHPFPWIRQAAGLAGQPLPTDDAELLIRCTAATISPQEETGLDIEEEALVMSLEHDDWFGAIVTIVRGGPGTDATPDDLAEGVCTCPELQPEIDPLDPDVISHLTAAFWVIALPWEILGLLSDDQRLTPVGEWVLPRALARAWQGEFD